MKLKVSAKAIFVSGGRVLIVSDNGKWDFPGGGIEDDERLPDALRREALEELGWAYFAIGDSVYVDEWFIATRDLHVVGVFYRCDISGQPEPKQLSEEHTEFAWISPEELVNYDVTDDTVRALEAAKL